MICTPHPGHILMHQAEHIIILKISRPFQGGFFDTITDPDILFCTNVSVYRLP